MSSWKAASAALAAQADRLSDGLRARVKQRTGYRRPTAVVPYLGYGTAERVVVSGRVLEQRDYRPVTPRDPRWRNALNLYRALESDEVPGATVRAAVKGSVAEALSDAEGYVSLVLTPVPPLEGGGWHEVTLQVLAPWPAEPASGRVLVPPGTARFGVISDIDDTVIRSGVQNKVRMLLALLLSNHYTRVPFEGVPSFYRALHRGASGRECNPIFYVSSSPWNLYAPLIDFLQLHDIPLGPLHLRDYGEHTLFAAGEHGTHKLAAIEGILAMYPGLPFVLIGDSGEQDPEIYREIVRRHPGRIRVVYIRNVSEDPARASSVDRLIEEVRRANSELVLVPDSEFAAAHAASAGLISTAELPGIRAGKRKDAAAPLTG